MVVRAGPVIDGTLDGCLYRIGASLIVNPRRQSLGTLDARLATQPWGNAWERKPAHLACLPSENTSHSTSHGDGDRCGWHASVNPSAKRHPRNVACLNNAERATEGVTA